MYCQLLFSIIYCFYYKGLGYNIDMYDIIIGLCTLFLLYTVIILIFKVKKLTGRLGKNAESSSIKSEDDESTLA